ncbi:MAG TPA: cell division protein FtsH, partial [Nocardiopsis listeri]|nr:cell division protein FtsH [Nocardiopsis listeri]
YRDVLDDLVLQLLERETLTKDEVLEVFAPVHKRPSRGSYTGYGKRQPSNRPPVLSKKETTTLNGAEVQGSELNGRLPGRVGNEGEQA